MLLKTLLTSLFIALYILILPSWVTAQDTSKIYLFYGTGCPHCAEVLEYFEEKNLFNKYPIEKKEIYFSSENAILFNTLLDNMGIPTNDRGVPAVIIGKKIIVGDRPIIDNFVKEADIFLTSKYNNLPTPAIVNINLNKQENNGVNSEPGTLKVNLTLPAVIAGSLVDAINPCEFAVLIILMTTILATGNSRKALLTGLTFSTSIFISYFLMGLGLYKALTLGNISEWFFKIIGWSAIILGFANLKDYFWYGKGFLMEVPLSWRPKLKSLIHSVTNPIGAFFIGFLVSLFLLPCTSGPYIVILGMLAKNTLDTQAISYLLLYNLIFVSPMLIISWAVYKGYDPNKAEEIRQKRLRLLHLIAGLILMAMGIIVLAGWI